MYAKNESLNSLNEHDFDNEYILYHTILRTAGGFKNLTKVDKRLEVTIVNTKFLLMVFVYTKI